jgi:hypothetical protein
MLRIEHTEDNLQPAYAFHRDGNSPRTGIVGIVYAHEAVELVKELYLKMSRLEQEEVLLAVVPENYCKEPCCDA